MNQQQWVKIRQILQDKLIKGCNNAVEIIKENTPIDTQRLYESTRTELNTLETNSEMIEVNIIAGGVEIYGIRREQDILREVDYGIYVERRDGYIRSNLNQITDAILEEFE